MLEVTSLQHEDLEKAILSFFREFDAGKEGIRKEWDEIEQYRFATDTTQTINAKGGFTHSTHLPDVLVIGNTLEALFWNTLFPNDNWFKWKPYESQAASLEVVKAITSYTKNRHERCSQELEYNKMVDDFVYKGNAFSHTFYVKQEGFNGSKTKRVSPHDIVFNPAEPVFADADKVVRENMPEGEFLSLMNMEGFDDGKIQKIVQNRSHGRQSRTDFSQGKDRQYIPAGFNSYSTYVKKGFVEVLWFYGSMYDLDSGEILKNHCVVVAEGQVVYMEEAEVVNGQVPIRHCPYHKRSENLWGMSPLAPLVGLNYMRNHRENAKSDALDRMIEPDMVFQGDVESIYDDETGKTIYLAPEGGGVSELPISNQISSFNPELDRLKQEELVASGLPQEFMGFRTAGEKTLGEVTSLADGAMRGFVHKAQAFEKQILAPSLNFELALEREYMTGLIEAPYTQPDGIIEFLQIDKNKLSVSGILTAVGSTRYSRNLKILTTLTQLSGTALFQMAASDVDPHALSRLLEDLTETELEGIFRENAALIAQAEQQQLMNQLQQQQAAELSQPSVQEMALG